MGSKPGRPKAREATSRPARTIQRPARWPGTRRVALYGSLDRLAKALRKHRLARPPRSKKVTETEAQPEATESLTSA